MGVGSVLLSGSADGVVSLIDFDLGAWGSIKESEFNIEDRSRFLLSIDECYGCRV